MCENDCPYIPKCDGCGKPLGKCQTDYKNCDRYCRKYEVEGHYNLDGGQFCVACWSAGIQWEWRSNKLKKEREEKNDNSQVS